MWPPISDVPQSLHYRSIDDSQFADSCRTGSIVLSHQACLFDTGVQLTAPNSESPSGVEAQTRPLLALSLFHQIGVDHPFIPNLPVVALSPHVDDQLTIVGHVQRIL